MRQILIVIFALFVMAGLGYLAYYYFFQNRPVQEEPINQSGTEDAGPKLSGNEIFVSNFDSESEIEKWEYFDDDKIQDGPSNWFLEDGTLKQDSNIWGGSYGSPVKNKSYLGSHIVTKEGKNWKDYYVHLRMQPLDNDGVGFLVRYQDKNNYLRIFTIQDSTQENGGPMIKIDKRVKGKTIGLYSKKFTYEPASWNDVNILVKESKITFWLGEKKKNATSLYAADNTFKKGRFGLSVFAEEGIQFDDVVIEKR